MKRSLIFLVAGFAISTSAEAVVKTPSIRKCSVYTGTTPYTFDRLLAVTVVKDDGIIAVDKTQALAKVLSSDEFDRRSKTNDFGEFAGGHVFFFNSQLSGDWSVMVESINGIAPFEFSDPVQAIGGANKTPVALVMDAKRLYSVCVKSR